MPLTLPWSIRLMIVSPILLLGTIFILLQVNHNITWNWGIIFIPEWVLFLLWLIAIVYALIKGAQMEARGHKHVHGELTATIFTFFACITMLLFFIFLTIHLQLGSWPWAVILSPLWVFMFICLLYSAAFMNTSNLWIGSMLFLTFVLLGIQGILIVVQIGNLGTPDVWGWGVAFVPLWMTFGIWAASLVYLIVKRTEHEHLHVSTLFRRGSIRRYYHTVPLTLPVSVTWELITLFAVTWLCLIAFTVLLTIKLDSSSSISSIALFTPLVALFGLVFIIAYISYTKVSDAEWMRRIRNWHNTSPPLVYKTVEQDKENVIQPNADETTTDEQNDEAIEVQGNVEEEDQETNV